MSLDIENSAGRPAGSGAARPRAADDTGGFELRAGGGPGDLIADLKTSLQACRFWLYDAWLDIVLRHRASKLGPIWIILPTALMIALIGFIFKTVLDEGISFYLYIGVGLTVWTLFQGVLGPAALVFVNKRNFILAGRSVLTHYPLKLVVQGLLVLAHNALLVLALLLWLGQVPHWHAVFLPISLALICVALFFASTILALLGSRFRDIPEMVTALLRVFFFVTPVFWSASTTERAEQLGPVLYLNPFHYALQTVRPPLLGQPLAIEPFLVVLAITGALAGLCVWLYRRLAPTTTLWI